MYIFGVFLTGACNMYAWYVKRFVLGVQLPVYVKLMGIVVIVVCKYTFTT